jgi:glycine/D-amino acid oxidase-like deaminating enzyme
MLPMVELAAYEPDSGYGDGAGVAGDFLGAARELGVTYHSRTQAPLSVEAGRIRGVVTDQGTISSPIVLLPLPGRGHGRCCSSGL